MPRYPRYDKLTPFTFSLLTLCAIWENSVGQEITYYEHVEPIIVKNCAPCHKPGQSAPFSLLTYEDVASKSEFIAYVTGIGYMPPWRADRSFQTYENERGLTSEEVTTLQQWVDAGSPKGKRKKAKDYSTKAIESDTPDLVLKMDPVYQIQTNEKDDYRFFVLPTGLTADTWVRKVEFIPGNKKLVHHSRLMIDTTGAVRSIQGMSANDPGISRFEKYPPIDKFFYGWVPGNFSFDYPKGTAKRLYKNSDIILNIHYAPNWRDNEYDQSTVNIYFEKGEIEHEVFSLAIAEESISNQPFLIEANQKKTFYSSFGPIPVDITAIAILPHMHYLGKTFRAFAITPEGDAINLIKINEWDFRWQETYQFKDFLHIPKNSVIIAEATFDNTAENPANPSSPPVDVTYGWNTTSEMFDMVIYYIMNSSGQ